MREVKPRGHRKEPAGLISRGPVFGGRWSQIEIQSVYLSEIRSRNTPFVQL